MEDLKQSYAHIPGWGVDADPENEPTYPMKNWTGDDHNRIHGWERPTQQHVDREVLHSNERPNLTAAFGTSSPPSGLSGHIRRFAFRFSESEYGHWLPLLLADRVNAIEGIVDDLRRGYVPNIIAERGWQAEWKYNRKGLMKNVAIGVGVLAVGAMLMSGKKKKEKKKLLKR
jgi:hypothetical protein